MAFYFTANGREYSFILESDGLIHQKDLGLKDETIEGLKEKVKASIKEEKSRPRIPVIILGDRWGYLDEATPGSASGKADRNGYRWVSYDGREGGRKKRQTISDKYLALDTPANREIVEIMKGLTRRITELTQQQKLLREKLQMIGEPEEE
jgi:hypothetical protein